MSQHLHPYAPATSSQRPPSIAFIGWNPFQVRHILGVAQKLKNSCILIEKRSDHILKFDENLLTESGVPVIIWPKNKIHQLDGLFDVIVCQTPFKQINLIKKSLIAMMQYGYAKASHNYGTWRSRANLCMVYGEHAARHIRPMCPVVITGNPSFDVWNEPTFHLTNKVKYKEFINPFKKTILYAPTWGELSTINYYFDEVVSLSDEYNVILKLHHNTDFLEKRKRKYLERNSSLTFGANTSLLELISISDIILSDYSGAIFDALQCKRPIILLHKSFSKGDANESYNQSLECTARHQIGPVIERNGILKGIIEQIIEGSIEFREPNEIITQDLYLKVQDATSRVSKALSELASKRQYA
jgi:CDP-Glycerol:Poly(glycerophosphate) glycerophosphotransferase